MKFDRPIHRRPDGQPMGFYNCLADWLNELGNSAYELCDLGVPIDQIDGEPILSGLYDLMSIEFLNGVFFDAAPEHFRPILTSFDEKEAVDEVLAWVKWDDEEVDLVKVRQDILERLGMR